MKVYFISDSRLEAGNPLSQAEKLINAGIDILQVREKEFSDGKLLNSCKEIKKKAEGHRLKLLVNGRFDMALLSDFDGIQLPENGIPISSIREEADKNLLIFKSCHSLASARRAEDDGADAITLGPIFDTPSKRKYGPPIGLKILEEVVKKLSIMVYAIGGINIDNAKSVRDAGANGIALIRALAEVREPVEIVKYFHTL